MVSFDRHARWDVGSGVFLAILRRERLPRRAAGEVAAGGEKPVYGGEPRSDPSDSSNPVELHARRPRACCSSSRRTRPFLMPGSWSRRTVVPQLVRVVDPFIARTGGTMDRRQFGQVFGTGLAAVFWPGAGW